MHLSAGCSRVAQIEIAEALPVRASMLSRLFLAQSTLGVSRTEVGVLQALDAGPCRITVLAAREGVTQPAITVLVNRMAARGWVRREADPLDGRVVLVAPTDEGRAIWQRVRREYRALLHEEMASLTDEDVDVLARATEILDHLIERLRSQARPNPHSSSSGGRPAEARR